jgi:hypothetical protein
MEFIPRYNQIIYDTFSFYCDDEDDDDDAICAKGWIDFDCEIALMVGYIPRPPRNVICYHQRYKIWRNN